MNIINDVKLDFNNVLMIPKRSRLNSRAEVSLQRKIETLHSKRIYKYVPVMAANMYNTGSFAMAKALAKHQMITCLHKFYSIEELVKFFSELSDEEAEYVFYTLGSNEKDFQKLHQVETGLQRKKLFNLNIDIANGYSAHFVEAIAHVRKYHRNKIIMAGNVCTPDMTQDLLLRGADIVKVGIGGGAHCTTRLVAGVGYPQLSAVMESAEAAHGLDGHICSDGGIVHVADVSKALGAGADFVMIGTQFMGYEENNGEWVDGKLKTFGMSSEDAQYQFYGTMAKYKTSEGRTSTKITPKGPVEPFLEKIEGGVRSCMTYIGARRVKDIPKCCTFVRVEQTHNTHMENL